MLCAVELPRKSHIPRSYPTDREFFEGRRKKPDISRRITDRIKAAESATRSVDGPPEGNSMLLQIAGVDPVYRNMLARSIGVDIGAEE